MHNQAEANLSALIESTDDFIWSVDLQHRLMTCNSALRQNFEAAFGRRVELGMRLEDLLPPNESSRWPRFYDRVLLEGPFRVECSLLPGRILELAFNLIVADGQTTGISVFGKDITVRQNAVELLRESTDSLAEAQRIAGLGSYVLDLRTGQWTSSEVLDQIFGIDKNYDHTVAGWVPLIHPDDRAMMAAYFADDVLGKGKPFDKEYRILRISDQAERWLVGRGLLDFDPQGIPLRMHGAIRDITESKRAELELQASEERYRATFEQAAVGMIHTSLEGKFLRCNARFAEIIGYPRDEIPGMTFQQITAPEDLVKSNRVLNRMSDPAGKVATSSVWEKRYVRKDGSLTWVKLTVSVQHDSEGRALHYIAVVEDIDLRKAAEASLAAAQHALMASEERYRTTFQMSIDAININRVSDGVYVDANNTFFQIMGYDRQEVVGKSSLELGIWFDPADRLRLLEELRLHSVCHNLEARFQNKNGIEFWGLMSASVIEIEGVPCVLSVTRDISEVKAAKERLAGAQEALRANEERYRATFEMSIDAININRLSDGVFVDVNEAFLDFVGFEREEIIGRTSLALDLWVDRGDRKKWVEALRRDSKCRNLDARFRKKNGEIVWGQVSGSLIETGGNPCILSITRDVTAAKAAEDKIWNLAFYDPLTGLPNRRLLSERLRQALAACARTGHRSALLFIDLDNFKDLNDTLGHQIGDLLLQEISRRLTECVRESDTVARLGGDEFVVMLEGMSESDKDAATQAGAVAEKVLASIRQPYVLAGRECVSSSSIGITVFGNHRENMNEVMQQADIAMYQAKAAGRNTMRFFAPALQTAVNARATLEEDLREAIKTHQFVLYYQPQMDRDRLVGAEALIRWNHPARGVLFPDEFIPLAEDTGLILPMGNWVLETACAQIAAWAGAPESAQLSIAVNISARQFREPDFVEQVLAVLERTQANPQNLRLELTESMLVENVEEVIDIMTDLKSHGVKFALDDFGTGYSSLSYLKRLPLDQLKIDRSFVWDMLADASSGAIAQTLISLGQAMGLSVIAEGVETEAQRECLTGLGCHLFQGYLFSRPLPLEEFQSSWVDSAKSCAL